MQRGESASAQGRKAITHHFALDVLDLLHVYGTDPISFTAWRYRFHAHSTWASANRQWDRQKAKLRQFKIPHERIWLHSENEEGNNERLHIRLLPEAREVIDKALERFDRERQLTARERRDRSTYRELGPLAAPVELLMPATFFASDMGLRPADASWDAFVHRIDVHVGYQRAETRLAAHGYWPSARHLDGEERWVNRWERHWTREELRKKRERSR